MSDSSSEDDIPDELLESVDKSFLPESLFSEKREHNANKKENNDCIRLPHSLRPRADDNNFFSETGLTKSNQSFIAKRLSKFLDEKLEKLLTRDSSKNSDGTHNSISGGILLFSDSNVYLSADDDNNYYSVHKKRKIKCGVNEIELEKRCKTIAVSSDWVLSGAATKGWCKGTKGEVIRVKKIRTNGEAVECELISHRTID